ncbi:MAG: hypothetical protein HY791_21810 [Deltaproteobacteria bacterium]|nr:hypothetical protein [Deltaproteobacteria bacterium]
MASSVVTYGILLLAVLVAILFFVGYRFATEAELRSRQERTSERVALKMSLVIFFGATWWSLGGTLASMGLLLDFDRRPPVMFLLVGFGVLSAVVLGVTSIGRAFAKWVPLSALVLSQSFRLPLELVMHRAQAEGVMPPQLSYSGMNFDILTGTFALLLGIWLVLGGAPRAVVWAWNLLGMGMLSMIAFIAIASTPQVAFFGSEPRFINSWVGHVPFVWLPTVLVPFAVFGHTVVTRALLSAGQRKRKDRVTRHYL